MSIPDGALGLFEGQAERVYWVPPLTLGYIYTITGDIFHFILTIIALAGGKYLYDVYKWRKDQNSEDGENQIIKILDIEVPKIWFFEFIKMVLEDYGAIRKLLTLALVVSWGISLWYSISLLFQYFDHSDLVLVGLGAIYGAVGILVVYSFT